MNSILHTFKIFAELVITNSIYQIIRLNCMKKIVFLNSKLKLIAE